jgi:hypothetical protein
MIKTYRGLLADNTQDRIRLSTIKGKVGYRIVKFQLIAKNMNEDGEYVVSVFKNEQSSMPTTYDFTDSDLLSAAFLRVSKTSPGLNMTTIIFDSEIFNQDIYITNNDVGGSSQSCNYYMELEVIPLDDAGAEYTTLKDMRST